MSSVHDRNVTTCPLCGERVVFVASVSQGGAHFSATHAPIPGCPIVDRLRAMLEANAPPAVEEPPPAEKAN